MNWLVKPFNELTAAELYEMLRLRSTVFVVEQNCVFLDMDNKDQHSLHLLGYVNDRLTAYSRLVPAGISYKEPSIGRVCTDAEYRNRGIGKELMNVSIRELGLHFGNMAIRIGAQLYLKRFYESFGFRQIGDEYLEDGIPHIEMLREHT